MSSRVRLLLSQSNPMLKTPLCSSMKNHPILRWFSSWIFQASSGSLFSPHRCDPGDPPCHGVYRVTPQRGRKETSTFQNVFSHRATIYLGTTKK